MNNDAHAIAASKAPKPLSPTVSSPKFGNSVPAAALFFVALSAELFAILGTLAPEPLFFILDGEF